MKKTLLLVLLFIFRISTSYSQASDWSTSIAQILYMHCSGCHHEGGIAPFSIMSYDDAVNNAFNIQADVNAGKMPPWPPDPDYSHFSNEKILSSNDVSAINSWVDGGMPPGDLLFAPDPPVFNNYSSLNEIDDSILVPAYTVQQDLDEFRTFVIHSNFTETKYLNQVEFIADDQSVVHHVFLFRDTSGEAYQSDQNDTLPGFHQNGFALPSPASQLVCGWVPGAEAIQLPSNMGFEIPPGSDFAVAFHYAPGSLGKTSGMKINLKFSDDPNVRSVKDYRFLYWSPPILLNPPFIIPANQVVTFFEANSLDVDKSMVAIQPHMHLLGKSFKVYMVTAAGDTTNLLYIPQWYFGWQMDYFLTKIIKVPANAQLIAEGTYDNTTNNASNPNNPPIDVFAGESTYDEMMGCHFSLLDYMPGDENIILDSSFYFATGGPDIAFNELPINVFPNPCSDYLHFTTSLSSHEIHWSLMNEFGSVLKDEVEIRIPKGSYAKEISMSGIEPGVYFLKIQSGEKQTVRKVTVIK